MNPAEIAGLSAAITDQLARFLPLSGLIAAFSPHDGEPSLGLISDTDPRRWALPRVTGAGTMSMHVVTRVPESTGAYGIREPEPAAELVPPTDIDVALVPGLWFGPTGERMGYGAGYYDRYLAQLRSTALRIGVCYSWQVRDGLPMDAHDIPMTHIATERGITECRPLSDASRSARSEEIWKSQSP